MEAITIHAEEHDWGYLRTDSNHSILVVNATLDGNVLDIGNELGVFTEAGMCAGMLRVTDEGFPTGLTAWGDDPVTNEIDGLVQDEKMSFRFWDAAQNLEYETGVVRIHRGGLSYQSDGITVLNLHGTIVEGASPRNWLFERTADNHSILFLEAVIGEDRLRADDMIGLFTADGLCVGKIDLEDDDFPIGLTAWADDPETELVDGFREGEEMFFRIWHNDGNIGMAAEVFDIVEGEVDFVTDGITVLSIRAVE